MGNNNAKIEMHLDWVDEECEVTTIRMASYHYRVITQYNKKARPQLLYPKDLVLRRVYANTAKIGVGKFQVNWEDSYVVIKARESRVYHL